MSRSLLLAGMLSFLVPGLGQIVAGRGRRFAAILFAAIVIGNLNAIWLSLYGLTNPGPNELWTYTLPRILHDFFAVYTVVFFIWQVVDAYQCVRRRAAPASGPLPS